MYRRWISLRGGTSQVILHPPPCWYYWWPLQYPQWVTVHTCTQVVQCDSGTPLYRYCWPCWSENVLEAILLTGSLLVWSWDFLYPTLEEDRERAAWNGWWLHDRDAGSMAAATGKELASEIGEYDSERGMNMEGREERDRYTKFTINSSHRLSSRPILVIQSQQTVKVDFIHESIVYCVVCVYFCHVSIVMCIKHKNSDFTLEVFTRCCSTVQGIVC